jgi:hypothetical protein
MDDMKSVFHFPKLRLESILPGLAARRRAGPAASNSPTFSPCVISGCNTIFTGGTFLYSTSLALSLFSALAVTGATSD